MTPKRKKALQWFHDKGEVLCVVAWEECPATMNMIRRLLDDGLIDAYTLKRQYHYALTNAGRMALHEARQ